MYIYFSGKNQRMSIFVFEVWLWKSFVCFYAIFLALLYFPNQSNHCITIQLFYLNPDLEVTLSHSNPVPTYCTLIAKIPENIFKNKKIKQMIFVIFWRPNQKWEMDLDLDRDNVSINPNRAGMKLFILAQTSQNQNVGQTIRIFSSVGPVSPLSGCVTLLKIK